MNSLLRLLWALPLVLAVGIGAMLLLRRWVMPAGQGRREARRLVSREQLALSDQTRVHLVEVDGHTFVVLESAQQALLQRLSSASCEAERVPAGAKPAWLQRLTGTAG